MCKFHKAIARDVATNPETGEFSPAQYAVALVAISKYRIEQYMPPMFGCDGYSRHEMATPKAIAAFEQSGMRKLVHHADPYHDNNIDALRAAMAETAVAHDVSLSGLNLPKDPVRDMRFLDEATVELFEGYTGPGYAGDEIFLKDTAHKPEFEPIRAAAAHFMAQGAVEPILRRMFEHKTAVLFNDAQATVNPLVQAVYERVPESLRNVFKTCAMCVGGAGSGLIVGHLGCVVTPLVLASSGATAMSGGSSSALALGAGATVTALGLAGWYKLRGTFASAAEKICVVGGSATGLVMAASLHMLGGGHDAHMNHSNHHSAIEAPAHSDHDRAMARRWLDSLPADQRESFEVSARAFNKTPEDVALELCGQDLRVHADMEKAGRLTLAIP